MYVWRGINVLYDRRVVMMGIEVVKKRHDEDDDGE